MTLRFIMLPAYPVFQARVNMPSVSWPVDELTFDGVFWGAYEDIRPGMLLRLGTEHDTDDRGRQRVRGEATATTIPVGRSSLGSADGELYVQDNLYISVFEDYRVWAKTPYIAPDGTMYKDSDIEVGTFTTDPPPVANTGPPAVGTIDSVTEQLQVLIPPVSNTSFATADGASITDYEWELPTGVTLADGYALTDDQILIDCDPGFHWIALTVTDSNGETHTARTFVYAYDPAAKLGEIEAFEVVSHRITRTGQTLSVRILEDAARDNYLDGTLVLLWDGEPNNLTDRSNMLFWGWLQTEPTDIQASRTATLAGTVLECVDVAGRLDTLPGFSQVVYNDAKRDTDANPDITWAYMVDPTWDKLLHYLLHWHSTALELADWSWSDTGTDYQFTVREAGGASLFEQVDRQAQSMCPDRYLTCNRLGQLAIQPDPLLQNVGDRTSDVQMTIAVDDWSQIQYAYQRPPRVHWLDESAVLSHPTEVHALFCHAPGDAPGQGEGFQTHGEQIAPSQDVLNQTAGHRYARLNARQGMYQITLAGSRMTSIDPALMSWVRLNISSDVAAQRGMALTNARGLVHEMTVRYDHARTGLTRQVDLLWERETDGYPAVTVIPAEIPPVGEQPIWVPPLWVPPLPGDERYYYGSMKGYVVWDGAHVFRTWDIQNESPTWELIDTGITGTIYDGQYVHTGPHSVGMWLMTSSAIWWCADILAGTPIWDDVLPIATVQAADADPPSGVSVFKCMANYASAPGYLIVATGPSDTPGSSYPHAYFWHTHDFGQHWTQVDMNNYTYGFLGTTHGYCSAGTFAMEIFRSEPGTIWCVRQTPPIAGSGRTAVFVSQDLGDTWEKRYELTDPTRDTDGASILHPFPAADDFSYIMRGNTAAGADQIRLYRSNDGWTTGDILDLPAGYKEISGVWRVNKRTFDTEHVMAWFENNTDGHMDLLESEDHGVTWALLYDSGLPQTSNSRSPHNTPNGWPPDIDEWVIVRTTPGFGSVIQHTSDRFQTLENKQGNLDTLAGSWTLGLSNGFALPRVGVNA